MKEGHGLPWNRIVVVHNKGDGIFSMRHVAADTASDTVEVERNHIVLTREDFLRILEAVSAPQDSPSDQEKSET